MAKDTIINNLKTKIMKAYPNNFADLDKLEQNGNVLVAKSNAECFLLTCKLAGINVKFELSDNKILFTLK